MNQEKYSAGLNYLLVRKTLQNLQRIEQMGLYSSLFITKKTSTKLNINRDLIIKRNLFRSIAINYTGCCVDFGFAVSESNPSSLTKVQRSFNLNFSIKNL